jgi:hypothetical protein
MCEDFFNIEESEAFVTGLEKTKVIDQFILKRIDPNEVTSDDDQVEGLKSIGGSSLKLRKIVMVKFYW